jgi:hypothetical protein
MGKMNKKQYALTILSIIGVLLYSSTGIHKPIIAPVNIVVYCMAAAVITILLIIIIPTKYCPSCGTKLPRFRNPASLNLNEKLYGWSRCPNCKAEINTKGQIVKE